MDKTARLKYLERLLARYKIIFEQKRRVFRGVRHENSLSELRYTEYMVYKDMVEGLEREIGELKGKN